MTIKEFFSSNLGKSLDWDSAYGSQCVDLFRFFCHDVLSITQPKSVSGAADFWTNYDTDSVLKINFSKISNSADFIPQEGDVAIWNKNAGGGFGHIAIVYGSDHTLNYFHSFDQNWSHQYCEIIKHSYKDFLGVLRPYNLPKEEDDMNELLTYLGVSNEQEAKNKLKEHLGEKSGKCNWGAEGDEGGFLGSARKEITQLKNTGNPGNGSDIPEIPGWEVNGLQVKVGDRTYNYKKV